jgi:hypothetical protein
MPGAMSGHLMQLTTLTNYKSLVAILKTFFDEQGDCFVTPADRRRLKTGVSQ